MATSNIIEVRELSKSYLNGNCEVKVLENISFEIETGSMLALLGPSGSGKTTLLNLLGLVDEPTSGEIVLGGKLVCEKSVDRDTIRRSTTGYIFQQFHLLPQFSALDNVCIPLVPVKTKFNIKQRAIQLLTRLGLEGRYDHLPSEMSGGEQQRVAIARALINSPKILLCDEPTGNLDTVTRDSIMDLLRELKQEGLTILIATHDEDVANCCDDQMVMRDGKIRMN